MRIAVASFLLFVLLLLSLGAQSPATVLKWYKGNLHAHTINSDGDSPPYDVMAWYKRNGYQFLAITDHNTFTDPALYDTNPNDNFLLIGAEEITNPMTVHVNAIGIGSVIPAQNGSSPTEILQRTIDAVREAGGIPLINHPNFRWAFTAKEMLPLKRTGLLEIASGHPQVNHEGDGHIASTEQMWDELLSSGMHIFAVAVDDVHNFRQEFAMDRANPGRAWVVVRAAALTKAAILAGLAAGDFYASTGVNLKHLNASINSLSIEIEEDKVAQKRYRIVFVGRNGQVLMSSNENPAEYHFKGTEGYVRARIEDSSGLRAWTQPVFVAR